MVGRNGRRISHPGGSPGQDLCSLWRGNQFREDQDDDINGEKLDAVDSFKFLGAVVTDQESKPELLCRIAQTIAALSKLKTLWNDRNILLSSKIRVMRSLVFSVLLYARETWTLTADIQKKLQATEMRCFRKLLGISYKDYITNDEVRNRIGHHDIMTTVKKRKLKGF